MPGNILNYFCLRLKHKFDANEINETFYKLKLFLFLVVGTLGVNKSNAVNSQRNIN